MKKFTLLEMLIVVAIIGILLTLLMPSLGKAKSSSVIAVCASNIKQDGASVLAYSKDIDYKFPEVQNHHGEAPYTTRVAYWSRTKKWYNLGEVYKQGYIESPQVFFCPQHDLNGKEKYTFGYNSDSGGDLKLANGDFYIRLSYNLLPNKLTTNSRRKLMLPQLESDDFLLSDLFLSSGATAHKEYLPGWNVMKSDLSVKFKKSKEAWAKLQNNSFGWDWNGIENLKLSLVD